MSIPAIVSLSPMNSWMARHKKPIPTRPPESRSRPTNTIALPRGADEEIRNALDTLLGNNSFNVDVHATTLGDFGAAAVGQQLTHQQRGDLIRFGKGEGEPFVLVEGLPAQHAPPPTPDRFNDDSKVQFTDGLTLGMIRLACLDPVAFEYENFGGLMRNVAPAKGAVNAVTSHGSKVPLLFHTDNGYEFEPHATQGSPAPRFLWFSSLRNRDANGRPVPTELLRVSDLVDAASPALIRRMRRAEFTILPGASNDREPIGPMPLLEDCPATGNPLLRFNDNPGQTRGCNRGAERAVAEFSELIAALESSVVRICVQPGSVMAFDNYRVLHRRASFDAGTDYANARWLRRCFACQDIRHGVRLDPRHRPFVWR